MPIFVLKYQNNRKAYRYSTQGLRTAIGPNKERGNRVSKIPRAQMVEPRDTTPNQRNGASLIRDRYTELAGSHSSRVNQLVCGPGYPFVRASIRPALGAACIGLPKYCGAIAYSSNGPA